MVGDEVSATRSHDDRPASHDDRKGRHYYGFTSSGIRGVGVAFLMGLCLKFGMEG